MYGDNALIDVRGGNRRSDDLFRVNGPITVHVYARLFRFQTSSNESQEHRRDSSSRT